jgi:hypothetical protein
MFTPDGLESAEGVKQGDPLGALFFALSMKPIYDRAVESDETGSLSSVAFLDDCTLIGRPDERLLRAFEVLRTSAREGGLEVNLSKTKFLWLHEPTHDGELPPEMVARLSEMEMEIVRGATMLLGAPVGTDEDKMKAMVMKVVEEQQLFFSRLKSCLMPTQEALILLRVCALPRLNHLCRTTPPRVLYQAAAAFDKLMYETFNSKLGLHLPMHIRDENISPVSSYVHRILGEAEHYEHADDHSIERREPDPSLLCARLQIAMPIRLSGFGLRSMVETMSFSYLASFVRVVHEEEEWWRAHGPTEYNNHRFVNQLIEAVSVTETALPNRKDKQLFPRDGDIISFIHRVSQKEAEERKSAPRGQQSKLVKLQATLGEAYGKMQLLRLIKLCSKQKEYDRIACLNQKSNDSHHWMLVLPSDRSLRMDNQVMKHAIRYRLGLNPYNITPPTCLCGKHNIYTEQPYHSLSCPELRSRGTNHRHWLLVQTMATWIARTGVPVWVEASGLSSNNKKRPDIVYMYKDTLYVVDVTVTDPFNSTNTKRVGPEASASHARSSANQLPRFDSRSARYAVIESVKSKMKSRHYQELIDNMKRQYPGCEIQFCTAGAFTTGGLFRSFQELIKQVNVIAQKAEGGWDPEEIIDGLKGCVAVGIQQGNSMVLNDSWNRIAGRNYRRLLPPDDTAPEAAEREVARRRCALRPLTEFSLPPSFSVRDDARLGRESSEVLIAEPRIDDSLAA